MSLKQNMKSAHYHQKHVGKLWRHRGVEYHAQPHSEPGVELDHALRILSVEALSVMLAHPSARLSPWQMLTTHQAQHQALLQVLFPLFPKCCYCWYHYGWKEWGLQISHVCKVLFLGSDCSRSQVSMCTQPCQALAFIEKASQSL